MQGLKILLKLGYEVTRITRREIIFIKDIYALRVYRSAGSIKFEMKENNNQYQDDINETIFAALASFTNWWLKNKKCFDCYSDNNLEFLKKALEKANA